MATLSQAELQMGVASAIEFWKASGVDRGTLCGLHNIQYRVEDLAGSYLGLAYPSAGLVLIDGTAAGYGWDNVDLVRVLSHEVGHMIGFEHDDPYDVMAPILAPDLEDVWPVDSVNMCSIREPRFDVMVDGQKGDGLTVGSMVGRKAANPWTAISAGKDLGLANHVGSDLWGRREPLLARCRGHRVPLLREFDLLAG
jgi:hypothetical protein